MHREGAEEFHRALAAAGQRVSIGMETSGRARWFERLLAGLKFELRVGDASEIRRKRGREQKTDRQDAQHILGLFAEKRFSAELGEPGSAATAVASAPHGAARTRIMNQLQAVALNEGLAVQE